VNGFAPNLTVGRQLVPRDSDDLAARNIRTMRNF
jgi:hypothetical protein